MSNPNHDPHEPHEYDASGVSGPQQGNTPPNYGNPQNAGPYGGQPGLHGQPQVVYVPEQKKPLYKRPGCLIPLILAIIALLIVGGCMAMLGGAANEVDKQLNAEHTITYAIEGDATDATVTYNVDETNTTQDSGVAAGWSKEVTVKGIFGGYISATNGLYDTGSITCKIMANGKTLSENTASGEFASASCSVDSTAIAEAFE